MKVTITLTNQITKAEIVQEITFTENNSYVSGTINGKKLSTTIYRHPDGKYFFSTRSSLQSLTSMPCANIGIYTKTLEEMAERLAVLYAPHILDGKSQPERLPCESGERAKPAWEMDVIRID